MTNFFTSKGKGSLICWMIIFCCLLPFIILSFFGFMASDDYTLAILYRDHSFGQAQRVMYFGWAGRFASTFLSGLFVKFTDLSRYYFIPALSLLFFTWAALYFLLRSINRTLLGQLFPNIRILQASFLFFFLNLYTMADLASGIYWFSSAIVYQSAFILFLFLLGCLIRRCYKTPSRYTLLQDCLLIGLTLAIVGCNEVAAVFLILFLSLIIAGCYFYHRPIPRVLFLYLAAAILTGILITLTSGVITIRHKQMNNHTSYLNVVPIIVFRVIGVFYCIVKEPLFWITAFFLWMSGVKWGASPAAAGLLPIFKGKNLLIPGLVIILLLVIGTLTPVLMASKGSLPPRSMNNLIALTTVNLLALFFITGAGNPAVVPSLHTLKIPSVVFVLIWASGLMASANYLAAWKSVFSGYFYHAVLEDRRQIFLRAKENHQPAVTILPYEEALTEKIHQVFPHGTFETVNEVLQDHPSAIYYDNEAENPSPTYLNYYGLEKITVEKNNRNF